MKLAKKMLACVIALALVAALGVTAFAASLDVTATTATVGETITVSVAARDAAGTMSGDITFTYDASMLEAVPVSGNDAAPGTIAGMVMAGYPTTGEATLSLMYTNAATTDDGLATYTFRVLKAGNSTISWTVTSWDGSEQPANGSISITATEKPTDAEPVVTTAADATTAAAADDTTKKVTIAQTGEAGIAAIAGVMAIAAVAFVATRKKDEQ